jgi:hypothetical protein
MLPALVDEKHPKPRAIHKPRNVEPAGACADNDNVECVFVVHGLFIRDFLKYFGLLTN